MSDMLEIKFLEAIMGTIKRNWENMYSIEICQSQIKNHKWHIIQT